MIDTPAPSGGGVGGALVAPTGGLRGWLGTLSPRDRAIYAIMITMLAIIVAIYLFVGLQTLFRPNDSIIGTQPTNAIGTDIAQDTRSAAANSTAAASPTSVNNKGSTSIQPNGRESRQVLAIPPLSAKRQ